MSSTPGTVSRILWHFTGGPEWDSEANKQRSGLKSPDKSFDSLNGILDSKRLKVGGYKEIVNVIIPKKRVWNKETKQLDTRSDVPITIYSSPVCCVADIPIQHLSYHASRYGKMAVGFYRESAVRHGFNPVMYTLANSHVALSIYRGYDALRSIDTDAMLSELSDIESSLGEIASEHDIEIDVDSDISDVESEIDEVEEYAEEAVSKYKDILAFVKTFDLQEFSSIYCEREWRATSDFVFTQDDVAMIVLPRSESGRNYYRELVQSNKVPRDTPIICWEDLIEHQALHSSLVGTNPKPFREFCDGALDMTNGSPGVGAAHEDYVQLRRLDSEQYDKLPTLEPG